VLGSRRWALPTASLASSHKQKQCVAVCLPRCLLALALIGDQIGGASFYSDQFCDRWRKAPPGGAKLIQDVQGSAMDLGLLDENDVDEVSELVHERAFCIKALGRGQPARFSFCVEEFSAKSKRRSTAAMVSDCLFVNGEFLGR